MDDITAMVAAGAAMVLAAYVGSQLMVRMPWTRAWIQDQAVKGYNYLDAVKDDVPESYRPAWENAYDALDAVVDAFADEQLTVKEIKQILMPGMALIAEIKRIVA